MIKLSQIEPGFKGDDEVSEEQYYNFQMGAIKDVLQGELEVLLERYHTNPPSSSGESALVSLVNNMLAEVTSVEKIGDLLSLIKKYKTEILQVNSRRSGKLYSLFESIEDVITKNFSSHSLESVATKLMQVFAQAHSETQDYTGYDQSLAIGPASEGEGPPLEDTVNNEVNLTMGEEPSVTQEVSNSEIERINQVLAHLDNAHKLFLPKDVMLRRPTRRQKIYVQLVRDILRAMATARNLSKQLERQPIIKV